MIRSTERSHVLVAIVVAIFLMVLCVAVPFTVAASHDSADARNARQLQTSYAVQASLIIRESYATLISGIWGLHGLVEGAAKPTPDNRSLNKTLRLEGQTIGAFSVFAPRLASYVRGIYSFQLQPSGIINQVYPSGSAPLGIDLLYVNNTMSPSLLANIQQGDEYYVDGPRILVQGFMGLVVRKVVFTSATNFSLDYYWGNVVEVIALQDFIDESGLTGYLNNPKLQWMLFANVSVYHRSDTYLRTVSSNNGTKMAAADMKFIDDASCQLVSLPQNRSWTVCMRLEESPPYFSNEETVSLAIGGTVGPILVTLLGLLLFRKVNEGYDGKVHAPKDAPFAYVLVGIFRPERLWNATLRPEELEDIRVRFRSVVREACAKVCGYETISMPDMTAMTTRSMEAAIHLCFSIGEELHRRPIIPSSGSGSVPFTAVVHLCNDAEVRYDFETQTFLYDGPDVSFATKLFAQGSPNSVIVSGVTAQCLSGISDVELIVMPPVRLKGVSGAVPIYKVHDKTRPDVWELMPNPFQQPHLPHPGDQQNASPIVWQPNEGQMIAQPERNSQSLTHLASVIIPQVGMNRLRMIFEEQVGALINVDFDSVQELVASFLLAFQLMFHPFAKAEKQNIFRRLVPLFGVPSYNETLEHLAVRCIVVALSKLQDREEGETEYTEGSGTSSRSD